ncbi:hypothetical protein HYU22_02015 [Candidatus Woesearchaeota archaeon]|nr:hypothetical protein [Candidatus Woesearchaeota archaeon]
MSQLITFPSHWVSPRGINPHTTPNLQKVQQYVFQEEYLALKQLSAIPSFDQKECTILYPGCGADIITPCLYLASLFPTLRQARLLLIDLNLPLPTIKAVLDDVGISFSEHQNSFSFYWNSLLIKVEGMAGNIFKILPAIPPYDIYFEKAFRIMKSAEPFYEENVFAQLRSGGFIISDSGFRQVSLRTFEVPAALSAYGEMIIGKKVFV